MIRISRVVLLAALLTFRMGVAVAQEPKPPGSSVSLPTSKSLTLPSPGRIGSTNSFPATIALSPDGHYAALLNDGYGTQETMAMQSIAVLDLKLNKSIGRLPVNSGVSFRSPLGPLGELAAGEEAVLDDAALAEAEQKYLDIKARIEALGPVNPQALEEFQDGAVQAHGELWHFRESWIGTWTPH